jgi:hypothetical protein
MTGTSWIIFIALNGFGWYSSAVCSNLAPVIAMFFGCWEGDQLDHHPIHTHVSNRPNADESARALSFDPPRGPLPLRSPPPYLVSLSCNVTHVFNTPGACSITGLRSVALAGGETVAVFWTFVDASEFVWTGEESGFFWGGFDSVKLA